MNEKAEVYAVHLIKVIQEKRQGQKE